MRRCLGRGGWLVVWRGEMSGRLSCAPFLSARVRGRWRWSLVFRSPRLASRLFCSFRRGGRCVACLASVGRGGCDCDVVSSRFLVPCWRPVCVFLIGVPCRLVCFSSLPSFLFVFVSSGVSCGGAFSVVWAPAVWRCVVAECGRCGVAMGVAMFVVWRRVVERAVGGSVMPCRVAERAVSGTRDGTNGETMNAPFLSARLGGLSDGGGVVDGCGREVCRGRGWCHPHVSSFFSCLSYRMRPGGGYVSSVSFPVSFLRLVLASRIGVSSIPFRCASRRGISLFVL